MAQKRYEARLVYDTQEKSKKEMVWMVFDKQTKKWWDHKRNRPTYHYDAAKVADWLNMEA